MFKNLESLRLCERPLMSARMGSCQVDTDGSELAQLSLSNGNYHESASGLVIFYLDDHNAKVSTYHYQPLLLYKSQSDLPTHPTNKRPVLH